VEEENEKEDVVHDRRGLERVPGRSRICRNVDARRSTVY